jgi:predicted alpha/beta superfamily hydrolase
MFMQKPVLLIICLMFCSTAFTQVNVSTGTIKRLEKFASDYVDARNVDVWLPADYSTKKKYAVLYMHDGQMLFDASTTWNKQAWEIDETLGKLTKDGKVKDTIVVGVWNNGEYRHSEYYPQKTLADLSTETRDFVVAKSLKDKPQSDNYLKFLVEELKPYIDNNFSTKKDVKNTFIAGSSMGGLISIYAICEYPNVFGGAAGISTHLPMILDAKTPNIETVSASFRNYLERSLPKSNSRKIYFDYGDQTIDAYYPPLQKKVDEIMKAKGWKENSWTTQFFASEEHSEKSWAKRLDIPLEFLLKK